jgi:hypothetical protein
MKHKHVTLPHNMEVDDVVHTTHYRDHRYIVLQNYGSPVESSQDPLRQPVPTKGESMFHVFRIVNHDPAGESLGEEVATYTSLQGAMEAVERLHATERKAG